MYQIGPLVTGGANGTTTLFVNPTNGDGVNGCNLKNANSLTVAVRSSDTSIATVRPATLTFDACSTGQQLTVTPKSGGTTTVSVSLLANTGSGTFNLAPATFTVVVQRPANTAPTVAVTGVSATAYEFGKATRAPGRSR